jgi:hypothetical protein
VLLGLVVAGGPATLAGLSAAGGPTATPTLTPVALADGPADRTGLSLGVTADGIDSVPALTRAHVDALGECPGMAMNASFLGPRFLTGFDTFRSGFDPEDEVRIRIRTASASRYHIYRRTQFPGGGLVDGTDATLERFADGTADYRALGVPGGRRYDRRNLSTTRGGPAELVGWARALFPRYLNKTASTVARLAGSPERYRVVATGRPRALDHETRGYRAVAIIRPNGFVRSLNVTYEHPRSGTTIRVSVRYERSVASVVPPEWYETARERTDP